MRWAALAFAASFCIGCGKGAIEDPYAIACGTDNASALVGCVSAPSYRSDLEFIGRERVPGSTHWKEVQDLCAKRFTDAGFEVERHAFSTSEISGVNVIGTLKGTSAPNERIYLSAHYDHIPNCPGADDNASGVAGVLEVARVLAMRRYARTLVVACWDQHEPQPNKTTALDGSRAYVARAKQRGEAIDVSFVFEMIAFRSDQPNSQGIPPGLDILFPDAYKKLVAGGSRANFIGYVSDARAHTQAALLSHYAHVTGLPWLDLVASDDELALPALSDLRRSDHSNFWDAGYPAVMITDTASLRNAGYHCRNAIDSLDTLDFDFATRVVRTVVGATADALGY